MLSSLIDKIEEIKNLFTENNNVITELEQNYSEKERNFLPALERQIFEIVYNNFTNNILTFTSYLANYKEWLKDTNNLPAEIKAKNKKEKAAINSADRNKILIDRLKRSQQIKRNK